MSDGAAVAWAHVALQALEIVGGIGGAIGGLVILLFRRTFASRDEMLKYFEGHATEHQELELRLAKDENRFTEISGAIKIVQLAAEQALSAANEARAAADHLAQVHVDIADLRGDIKAIEAALHPIERLTMSMVDGHMADGRGKSTRTRA